MEGLALGNKERSKLLLVGVLVGTLIAKFSDDGMTDGSIGTLLGLADGFNVGRDGCGVGLNDISLGTRVGE